jgi:hypothetical protein
MKPQTANYLTAAGAIGVFLVVSFLLAAVSSRPTKDDLLQRPSTFFTDATGARALLLITAKLLPSVEQWRRPLDLLPIVQNPDHAATLIVAGPTRPLGFGEANHLEHWLSAGGQLILLSDHGWPVRGRTRSHEIDPRPTNAASETFLSRYAFLQWSEPTHRVTGLAAGPSLPSGPLTLSWRRAFSRTEGARVIAAAGNLSLAVEISVGRGRIVAIADPSIATNSALRRSDNAVWLVDLAAGWGSGRIFFDEYHHGFGQKRSTGELSRAFMATPWGWAVLQLVAAGLLYIFGYRRRFGRIRETPPVVRASPLEAVEARAGIFRAAAAQDLAAEMIVHHLCHARGAGRAKDLENSDLRLTLRNTLKNCAAAGALDALYTKLRNGRPLSDGEFVELGRRAGSVLRGDA